jgi:hypothetical protein
MLLVTSLSWYTLLKFRYEFPSSDSTQTSVFKAQEGSSSFSKNVGIYQCYNVTSQNDVILIYTAVRETEISANRFSLFIASNSLQQNPSGEAKLCQITQITHQRNALYFFTFYSFTPKEQKLKNCSAFRWCVIFDLLKKNAR